MRHKLFALAALVPLAAFVPASHAVTLTAVQSVLNPTNDLATLTYTFSGLSLDGFEFVQVVGPLVGFQTGKLTAVSVNATLDASVDYTYADDLTIYVDPAPLSSGGLLQVGGFSSLGASERHFWANGGSSAPGTTVIDSVTLTTPITFAGNASDPVIWLGNGYGAAGTNGTWTGSISLTITAVPEPSTWALFAAGSLGIAAWLRRRRPGADQA